MPSYLKGTLACFGGLPQIFSARVGTSGPPCGRAASHRYQAVGTHSDVRARHKGFLSILRPGRT